MYIKNKINKIVNNSFWKKLIKNVLIVLIGNGGSSVINFFVTIIMIQTLGSVNYGIFLIAIQYMNLIDGIVNFQSWVGVIKYGSEAIIEKNEEKLAAIFKSGFKIDILTAILGLFAAITLLPEIGKFWAWNESLMTLAGIFSIEIIFHIEGTSIGVLRLFNKFNLTAIQAIIAALIKLILIGAYMLLGGQSLYIVVVLYVITDILKHLLLVVMAINVLNKEMGIEKVLKSSTKILDKSFLKYTLWNNIGYTADVPVKYFDVFIIGQISVELVAIYKVFKQIIQVLSMLISPISMAILPQFSELIAQKKGKEAYIKVIKLRNVILKFGLIAIGGTSLFGRPIFSAFLGEEYGNNLMLFEILLTIQIGLFSYVAIHPFFASLGKAKQEFIISLSSNLIYMFVAFTLVSQLEIYAVIIATAIQGYLCVAAKIIYAKQNL